jgi:hypothetical protein
MGKWLAALLLVSLTACAPGCGGGGGGGADPAVGVAAPPAQQQRAPVTQALLDELDDGTDAIDAGVLPDAAFLERQIVPVASIDLAIDRRELLRALFDRVTQGQTGMAAVEAWTVYIQRRFVHPRFNPRMDNGSAVLDPLTLLRLRVGSCGQVNLLLVDGLLAAGFQARTVHILNAAGRGHVVAEVWHGGQWRMLDADWLNNGAFVRKPDGTIPSALEISQDPSLLVGLDPEWEHDRAAARGLNVRHTTDTLAGMYVNPPAWYQVKTATPEQESWDVYFGWGYLTKHTQH